MNILEQLTKMSLGKKAGILLAIVALGGVFYWFVFYVSLSEELDNLIATNGKLQMDKQKVLVSKKTYDRDRRKLEELKEDLGQQIKALPTDTKMSEFLENLNSQAELVGLEIQSVKPMNEEPTENYVRIPVQLELRGSYLQLAKFFYLVGNLDRIINMENISLKILETKNRRALLDAQVLATTFRSLRENDEPSVGKKKKRH
jgi:type IV pilus assembly protein PilO